MFSYELLRSMSDLVSDAGVEMIRVDDGSDLWMNRPEDECDHGALPGDPRFPPGCRCWERDA